MAEMNKYIVDHMYKINKIILRLKIHDIQTSLQYTVGDEHPRVVSGFRVFAW